MRGAMTVLAAACLLIGILPGILLRPLASLTQVLIPGGGVPDETLSIARIIPWIAAIILGTTAITALPRRAKRLVPTWGCGLSQLTHRMQYTSTAFSKPIRFVFSWVYKPDRRLERLPPGQPYFPTSISYRSVRTTSYEKALYRPFVDLVLSAAHQLRRLQTGNIQVYLLYIFLTLVSLLILLRFQR
jgi:hypothetical protein